jgi:DNA-binding protein HU-beta
MTRKEIAAALCERIPELSKSVALRAVDGFTDILTDSFVKGEGVYLRGFGTFEPKTTKEKKARNISNGTTIVVPASRTVKFRIYKQLKNRLNNGTVD